ncbi:SusC/RagA family TonB-linked outer membrane protein [Flagellimonas sp.]|uniref:SusC/RagA family TonB-linked outer membrane protein n=1 Tax=Flagellimonas sp. TaxID=2058762 RepID=UPI003AB7E3C3
MKIFTKPWDGPLPVPKPDLKMKLTVFLFVLSLFQLQAGTGYAQKEKVTLDMQGVSVTQVIEKIEDITEFDFLYRPDDLDLERKVSIKVRKQRIEDILRILFKDTQVHYKINDKLIILSKRGNITSSNNTPIPEEKTEANQQQFEVNGTITDPEGNPLPGVNIIIKGTNQGTMSDPDGKYAIRVQTNDILTFSYVGFKRVELPVNGPDTIDLQMEEDVMSLEGVEVNAGYYTVKEREMTGNISRIAAQDIEKQPVTNPLQALQGRMPGVYIQQTTGVPGGEFNIQIRGQNSLRNTVSDNGNIPLYVVNGVPFPSTSLLSSNGAGQIIPRGSPLNAIDPNDIESVEILKDADATAIYGSRGANGVVLITTKKGKVGKSKVDVNVYRGLGKVSNMMDLLNTQQYLEMRNEAFANDGTTPSASNYDINGTWDPNRYTDWQKELIGGTAETTNVQATLSGGNENTQFLFRTGYQKETSVYPGDMGFDRFSGLLNVNHISENKKFQSTISANFSSQNSNLINLDYTSIAIQLAPNAPTIYGENGELNWENSTWTNPLAELERKYEGHTINFVTSANLSYQLVRGLRIKTNLGYNYMQVRETRINSIKAINPAFRVGRTGSTVFGGQFVKTWIVEPQIDYNLNIGDGVFNVLAGVTFQETVREGEALNASGYTSDALLLNKQAATSFRILEANYSQYRYNAIYGRINYNWREKYIINVTGRRDGSTRFGPGKQFGNFGAVGAAWIFSNENFIQKSLPFIAYGKLRASYGITGSDNIGDYQFLSTYSPTTNPYAGSSGLLITRIPNDDFSWESVKKLEVGLELGLLRDRIILETSWYRNRSSDQLVGFPLPVLTGASSVQANLPATVENKGWEFNLKTLNLLSKGFTWRSNVNLTIPRNTLIDYPSLESSPFSTRYVIGKSLFVRPAFHDTGVDSETGVYTFQDVNGDGILTSQEDFQSLKEIAQDFYGGVQNSISYKGIELDFMFQFVKQTGFTYLQDFNLPGFMHNQPTEVLKRWQEPGDVSEVQRFTQNFGSDAGQAYSQARFSGDNRIGDASFIRLRNVSLSYNFPRIFLKQLNLDSLKLYIQGQNLWTITKYVGFDPETQSSRSLPPLRMIVAGLQISL